MHFYLHDVDIYICQIVVAVYNCSIDSVKLYRIRRQDMHLSLWCVHTARHRHRYRHRQEMGLIIICRTVHTARH